MSFNKVIMLCAFLSILITISCTAKKQPAAAVRKGFAVVELYTSEGCSSCPAAEAVLANVQQENNEHVYVMEFHVDYWNYIGWKDVYGSSEYTKRQQKYAAIFHLNSTYTPQAIVNGTNELVGSEHARLHEQINIALQKPAETTIQLSAKAAGDNVSVSYSVSNNTAEVLNIALVQKKAETNVRRGENSGKKLVHTNVVRVLKTIDRYERAGKIDIALPEGLNAGQCMVIAYTQVIDTWKTTGAVSAPVN